MGQSSWQVVKREKRKLVGCKTHLIDVCNVPSGQQLSERVTSQSSDFVCAAIDIE
jgi:hypothetical protein